jgi:hypothetical protein
MNDKRTNARSRPGGDRPGASPRLLAPAAHQFRLPTRTTCQIRLLTRAALLIGTILLASPRVGAQAIPISGSASDFNSVEYYKPPNQQDIEALFSGTEADPLPGGLLLIKQVKIEKFDLTGKLLLVAEAPDCVYDPVNAVANSPGEVHLRSGDGQLKIDGEGFLWRQNDSMFTISNQVNTVIDRMPASKR